MDTHTSPLPPPQPAHTPRPYVPGIAPIKAEYLLQREGDASASAAAGESADVYGPGEGGTSAGAKATWRRDEEAARRVDGRGGEAAAAAAASASTSTSTSTSTSAEAADGTADAPPTPSSVPPVKLKGAARKKLRQAEARARREAQQQQQQQQQQGGSGGGSQNKRRRFFNKADEGALCHDVADGHVVDGGRACSRSGGEKGGCNFSHALDEYLRGKSRDVYLPVPPGYECTADGREALLLPLMYGAIWKLEPQQQAAFIDENYSIEEPYVKWGVGADSATTTTTTTTTAAATPDCTQSLDERTACPIYGALTARPIWDVNARCGAGARPPRCPYGFRCRFLGGHVRRVDGEGAGYMQSGLVLPWQQQPQQQQACVADTTATQTTPDSDLNSDSDAFRGAHDESNYVPPNLSRMLRKKEYPLYRTRAVLDILAQEDRDFQRTGVDAKGPLGIDVAAVDAKGEDEARRDDTEAAVDEDDLDALVNARVDTRPDANTRAAEAATSQSSTSIDTARIRRPEKRRLDWHHGELYLAPLTTTGNLPFRRICATFGSDIHCGEMGLAGSYLEGNKSEWSLVRRWEGERTFGIQLCGSKPELLVPTAEIMAREFGSTGGGGGGGGGDSGTAQGGLDFVDINCGCPIDLVFNHGGGSALLDHPRKLGRILRGMDAVLGDVPVTVKLRTGVTAKNTSHARILPRVQTEWGAAAVTMHGRSRKQRYSKRADWEYIRECGAALRDSVAAWNEESRTADEDEMLPVPFYGNGDVYSQGEYYAHLAHTGVDGEMIARGALIKPWLFTEIKERRDWDISSRERLDVVRQFCAYGLTHWGSDTQGVNKTRRFLCEALSFMHRYVPLGLLEHLPPSMNDRPPLYRGRDDLETLLASDDARDWVRISEMFLGKCSDSFEFTPKHKSNSYADGGAEQQG